MAQQGASWQQQPGRWPASSSSTSHGCWPGRTARSCSPTSARGSSRSSGPATATTPARIGPFVNGQSAYFASLNRGKESIDLDLKDRGDRRVFEALLDRADVLVENFRPGTMADLGYPWEVIHERWPRLVQASVSGFGQTGPMSDRPGLRHGGRRRSAAS